MPSMKSLLSDRGMRRRVALTPAADALLTSLQLAGPAPEGSDVRGIGELGITDEPLGILSINVMPPGRSIPFHLVVDDAQGMFQLWLTLSDAAPAEKVFT